MQRRLIPSNIKNSHWLEIAETLSVLGSIGGSLVCVVSQQVAFASIPLSLAVALNLVNRKQLIDGIQQSHQTAIAQSVQEKIETQTKFEMLTEQVAQVKQLTTTLGQDMNNLQDYSKSLNNEQTKIAELVDYLQKIETYTQTVRINPQYAEAYYNRGVVYQCLGDKQGAIGDYTEAIRNNPSYAQAYHNRGLIRADLGDKKGAVTDLREAAKYFFEEADIANYHTARDLSKKIHELSVQPTTEVPQQAAVKYLFS
ncbi:tetratricopeptide repeat protein [Gloeocapsopsis dulcis]|uniref:Uncharacterized protein n=1 Tax=Gloeocapsopsis dulcis AAB1 = 1H9 TaxID=1433147 RepID=A0A6N8FX13_9CHRO|nr:tetratricopeptide repeat protein [Gloeocapsopsis dulcis]MUL36855.1 hypothetical protein [Gloeocapsopsis dulcis AAB1 = 1H9]WNN88537.1 tetratricopeptide repeat protein [Gloeocapsopsis dulcis]